MSSKIKNYVNKGIVFVKQNKVFRLTAIVGISYFVFLTVLYFCGVGNNWWQVFEGGCTVLGYLADLAIVGVIIKYLTSETLTIKGIGKFKIRRMQNNIQDLTNLISWKIFDGDNFKRNTLLEAFYKDTSMEEIERDPNAAKYKIGKPESYATTNDKTQSLKPALLINLSNHPYDTWSDSQKKAAEEFGECKDIPFPNIPSDANEKEIDKLAMDYLNKILQYKKSLSHDSTIVVHIMGEQTFCYNLVSKLQKAGVVCVASCTTRDVTIQPDGSKQARFHFARFREYNIN